MKIKIEWNLLSHVWLFATPWTVACQAPLSMGFSRQWYWSSLPFLPPRDLPDPGTEPKSPALQADSLPSKLQGKPKIKITYTKKKWCLTHTHTHTHTMNYYSAIKKNETMPFSATWMALEIIILSKISQEKDNTIITYIWNLKYDTNELIYKIASQT